MPAKKTTKFSFLSAIYDPESAERHPWEGILIGLVYSLVAVVLARAIFPHDAGIVMVTLATISVLPLTYNIFAYESTKNKVCIDESCLLSEHRKALKVFAYLFVGFVLGYLAWFVMLPPAQLSSTFAAQIASIAAKAGPSGSFLGGALTQIVLNNLKIVGLSFAFSLLFGAGAIFILGWNASVMATAIGTLLREKLAANPDPYSIIHAAYTSLGQYATHGAFEIMAFFTAGLAGGILFQIAVHKRASRQMLVDAAVLLGISVTLVIIGAAVEVYATPALMRGF